MNRCIFQRFRLNYNIAEQFPIFIHVLRNIIVANFSCEQQQSNHIGKQKRELPIKTLLLVTLAYRLHPLLKGFKIWNNIFDVFNLIRLCNFWADLTRLFDRPYKMKDHATNKNAQFLPFSFFAKSNNSGSGNLTMPYQSALFLLDVFHSNPFWLLHLLTHFSSTLNCHPAAWFPFWW